MLCSKFSSINGGLGKCTLESSLFLSRLVHSVHSSCIYFPCKKLSNIDLPPGENEDLDQSTFLIQKIHRNLWTT